MARHVNHHKYEELRQKHPVFTYESYDIRIDEAEIALDLHFSMGDDHHFFPGFRIPRKGFFLAENISTDILDNLAFSIGMIELISYWKAACSPEVVIRPHSLTDAQINWWKNVYYNGLGEFFYLNTIVTGPGDFMTITAGSGTPAQPVSAVLSDTVIVPVGGGKDSVVTLKLLGDAGMKVIPFIMNPAGATLNTIETAGYSRHNIIEVTRRIDTHLLELNRAGFLNGHTPFSAMLAFYTLLAAVITGSRSIALSNESSANESTIPGTKINHQYSKSFSFESDFREYCRTHISSSLNYFSFLRPLNELAIARIFSRYPEFFSIFRSCNAGSKTGVWCGVCPKCLFAAIITAPWLGREQIKQIFGKDILDDLSLTGYFNDLCGLSDEKPFECVGTVSEVNVAMSMIVRSWDKPLPALACYYSETSVYPVYRNMSIDDLPRIADEQHFLEPAFLEILQNAAG